MPFDTVGRTGSGMKQVMRFGDRSMRRGNFGGKYGVPHCSQWGLFTIGNSHCATVRLLLVEFLGTAGVSRIKMCRFSTRCG